MNLLMEMARSSWRTYRAATNPFRLTPDFLIIGAQRGGTTSLYNYLSAHPQVAPAAMKEVHFFDNNFQRGLAWYRAQFPSLVQKYLSKSISRRELITGEASPYYLFHPHAARRAAECVPEAKLIVLLRNPVERAYSHYYHEVELGHEKLSFEEALAQEAARTHEESERVASDEHYYSYAHQHYTYRARGIYADQLQRWLDLFPREQLLIIASEDFSKAPDSTLHQIEVFLNITSMVDIQETQKHYNASSYGQSRIDPALRKELVEYFKPHNERLYHLLGRDFGWA